ncbi:Uncharacterised protein [uncultured archaeon]|nr:Uncharacterised protein [uncultured archaeon]
MNMSDDEKDVVECPECFSRDVSILARQPDGTYTYKCNSCDFEGF